MITCPKVNPWRILKLDNSHSKKNQPILNDEPLLLQRISEGDWAAYTNLFEYYLPKLSQYIYPFSSGSRQDTEEVIQEVFLKIWEKRDTLMTINSFNSYLFRMAKNKVLDLIDQRKSYRNFQLKYVSTRELSHTEPEQSLQYADYNSMAKKAIDLLSPKLQTVFLMSSQLELSLDEISSNLHLPKETVKKRLYLASRFIKDYLKEHAEWLVILVGCFIF